VKEHVSFIPPHTPFLETFADFLLSTYDQKELARSVIFLPTHRACQKLEQILWKKSPNHATLLPRFMPLGALDEEELSLESLAFQETMEGFPPLIDVEKRLALLTREIQHFYLEENKNLKTSQACALAKELLRLIDQVQLEGLDFSRLKDLVPEEYASHFQRIVAFLEIIALTWSPLIQNLGQIEPGDYQRRLLEYYARKWEENPPSHPVIAAGSTGSIPATAQLLKSIKSLPHGLVILPGFDPSLKDVPPAAHPQHTMHQLLKTLEIEPEDVLPLAKIDPTSPKTDLLNTIFNQTPKTFEKTHVKTAMQNLSLAECSNQQEEATVIALAIREQLETSDSLISFITANRLLARRVVQELKRWNILANDSGGVPLSETPLGIFCLLTAGWIQEKPPLATILATLKHPYAKAFKRFAHTIEKRFLRQGIPFDQIDSSTINDETLQEQYKRIKNILSDAKDFAIGSSKTFQELWDFHKELLEMLTQKSAVSFNETEEANVFETFSIKAETSLASLMLQRGDDYQDVLRNFLELLPVRQKQALHPRLSILGLIEARLVPADMVILGDLNEGSWPSLPPIDPWFNQSMRKQFGLPEHDRRVGLSALDFIQACSAPCALLTRSLRTQGTPTVPSRFLTRLQSYLGRFDLQLYKRKDLLNYAESMHTPDSRMPLSPPAPTPPIEARPKKLSITDITTLIHDPYSIYAKKILNLKPLKSLEEMPGRLEFGLFIHDVLEHFLKETGPTYDRGIAIGKEKFFSYFQGDMDHNLWWYRFENILKWVLKHLQVMPTSWQEVKGDLEVTLSSSNFTLIGKADRIDQTQEGMVIIDYKTGTPPSKKDMKKGLFPQLPLEALILTEGSFEGIPSSQPTALSFWRLVGDDTGGEIIDYRDDMKELLSTTKEGLIQLLEAFNQRKTPYLSTPYQTALYGEYHHLARLKEWSIYGEGS
jgi:ATP-dependent helicase/nuclease subunit B